MHAFVISCRRIYWTIIDSIDQTVTVIKTQLWPIFIQKRERGFHRTFFLFSLNFPGLCGSLFRPDSIRYCEFLRSHLYIIYKYIPTAKYIRGIYLVYTFFSFFFVGTRFIRENVCWSQIASEMDFYLPISFYFISFSSPFLFFRFFLYFLCS